MPVQPPIIVPIHGIHTQDPAASIGRVCALFVAAGFAVAPIYRYGAQRLAEVRSSRDELGFGLLSTLRTIAMFNPGREIIPLGHSRGCLAIHDAALRQYESVEQPVFTRAVYICPALDRDIDPPQLMQRIDVLYTRSDRATWWARLLPWHPFGDMGRVGYRGVKSPVMQNHNATGHFAGHSGAWEPKGLRYIAEEFIPQLARSVGFRLPSLGFLRNEEG